MEKKLTFAEIVEIKNLLTHIKQKSKLIDESQIDIHKTVDKINEILNKQDDQ